MNFSWKKLAIVSLCWAVGTILALGGLAFSIHRYEHRSTPAKNWAAIDLPMLGVRAHLRTEVRTGTVAYMYFVEPLSAKFADDFARVASDPTTEKRFDMMLRDKGGFQLCHEEMATFTPRFDDAGKAIQLSSEGSLSCPAHEYLDARQWEVTWHFPKLSDCPPYGQITLSCLPDFIPDKPDESSDKGPQTHAGYKSREKQPTGKITPPSPADILESADTEKRTTGDNEEQIVKLLGLWGLVSDCEKGGAFLYDNALLAGIPVMLMRKGQTLRVWPSGNGGSYAAQVYDFQTATILRAGFLPENCLSTTWTASPLSAPMQVSAH
jgi:hypothetical protein